MMARRATYAALIAWVALTACGGKKSPDHEPPVKRQEPAGGSGDAAPTRAAITPKSLAPVLIHEIGADGVVPTAIVIDLASPIIERDSVGSSTSREKLKISPEVAGNLVHTGISQLMFVPHRPLDAATTYQVELTGLDTMDGPVAPPDGERWSYSFKTPAFTFLGGGPTDVDLDAHKLTLELRFSGAVRPNMARAAMSFTIDGKAAAGVMLVPSGASNRVLVQVQDPALVAGSKLAVSITDKLTSATDVPLRAARAEYVVTSDKVVSLKTATIAEGGSGFYLEVACDDGAAPEGHRGYYDGGAYERLSERCQLTEDAIQQIHFEPPVPRAYVTSGRSGFRVFGDFKRGIYKVKIDAGATSVDGGTVRLPLAQTLVVPARKPQLSFASSGRYLPRSAWTNLGIKHTNVDAANLIVRQVPPENLVFWLGESSDAATERTSNVILKKTIPLRGDRDAAATTWLDVASLLPASTKGVLELSLVGVGAEATSRLLLTNMSLVAKKTTAPGKPGLQTVQVWALGIDSANLLSGADVSLVRKSGKVVARCTTRGKDGCTLVARPDSDPDDAVPFALIARMGEDLTYIRYEDLRADVTESSTSGAPYVADSPYRAAVFADRGVYRPGDTAHVVAIVRDAKDRAPEQPLPVDVQVLDPRARVVKKLALKTNAAGELAIDQAFPAFADTGHWRVALKVADKPLASHGLLVEEFVPERMAVTAAPKQAELLGGAKATFDVTAKYLFGGSAIDSGVELTCTVAPERFQPAEHGDLTYGVEPKGKPVSLGQSRAQLDPNGRATITCPDLATGTTFTETARLTAMAAVLEAGSGRASVASASVTLHPEKYYLGLRTKATRAVAGEKLTIEGTVVDWAGKLAPSATSQVHVELAHLEADYGYGYDGASGDARYDRWLRTVPEGKLDVKVVGGKLTFDVTPGEASAGYLVRVTSGNAKTELVLDGEYPHEYYGYGDDGHADQTPRPAKPTQLAMKLPEQIKVGEVARVSVRSPYRGKVLWTVETDRVVTAEWHDIAAGEATWSFTLDQFAPNVYVSAFIIKDPHLESKDAFLPDRAFGVGSVKVAAAAFTQDVKLTAPKEIKSRDPLAITLEVGKTDGPAFATVAVVDEGILSLTGFSSPDPLGQLFARRALGVETFETIGWTMLHQPAGASSRTGGGDDAMDEVVSAVGGALGQDRVQAVKPVALFSGIVPVGKDGKLTIPFEVPQYRGQLRVMAVVATPSRIGRAEAKVTVRDPLVVQVTFPRFVTQGDELEIPVFMTNLSGGPLEVSVMLKSEHLAMPGLAAPRGGVPPLAITGKDAGLVRIAQGFSETVVFRAKAQLAAGGARLRVVARAKGAAGAFDARDEVDVPFLPSGPRERVVQKLKLEAGKLDLAAKASALASWMPTSETTTFWMTANPFGEAFEHLGYLVHYPYGCIEQTTSATRPLLYLAGLVEQVDPQLAGQKIEDMVLAGIQRVFAMETPSGGFGYWPGATEPLEWATAYAVDMLLDARKLGYAVPEDRLKQVLDWIENRAAQYERGWSIKRVNQNNYGDQSEAYLHYVLARAGKGKKARIASLIAHIPAGARGEQAEDLYLLKAALYLAGDRRYEKDLKAVDASPISGERTNSWSFYSDRRRRGLMLSTFFDLFGNDPAGEPLAQRVAESLSGQASQSYTTQELVWGVTGLGKWAQAITGKGTPAGTLVADGATVPPRAAKHQAGDKAWVLARASEAKQLAIDVPAQAAGSWLVIRSEGVRPGGDYQVGGNGLTITRRYKNLAGNELDLAKGTLKLGELVFIELEISNTSGDAIQNIALVDRLPAGFEVENPRLGRSAEVAWMPQDALWATDFLNLRDDHLEAFGALPARTTKKLLYTVRAVTSGTFTVPPVEAGAMYDPTLWARAKGGTAVIGGPWAGKLL